MQLKRLGHVFLVVSDARRAKDFYTRVLGFEIIEEDPAHGGVFMALREGGHVLDLVGIGSPGAVWKVATAEKTLAFPPAAGMIRVRSRSPFQPAMKKAGR